MPLARLGTSNKAIIDSHLDFLVSCVTERLFLLSNCDLNEVLSMSASQMVKAGLVDPVRLFVKQEPHPIRKIKEGRYRLISSVSLVDQLVERMMFGPQNQLEISEWAHIPSKPGMGLSLAKQGRTIIEDLRFKHHKCPAAEADISGFDWTIQSWELWADVEMRIALGNFPEKLANAARVRFACFMKSTFQLSNGILLDQDIPGLMKSGSYCTSSTNSRIRCLMAELIGSPWCIAMGDDSVEGWVEDAMGKYKALGHVCKEYTVCQTDVHQNLESVNFCSHHISDVTYLTSWPKTLFRHLSSGRELFEDIEAELINNPKWSQIKNYLVQDSMSLDKTNRGNGDGFDKQTDEGTGKSRSANEETSKPTETSAGSPKSTCTNVIGHGASCYECYSAQQRAADQWI